VIENELGVLEHVADVRSRLSRSVTAGYDRPSARAGLLQTAMMPATLGPGGSAATPGPGGKALARGVAARAATANAAAEAKAVATSSLGVFPNIGVVLSCPSRRGVDVMH
jgi:hypothetical protein